MRAALSALEPAPAGVSWISLGEQDNDPLRLYALLTVALTDEGDSRVSLQERRGEVFADALELLLTTISLEETTVLVLDGVDLVCSQPAQIVMKRLLRNQPDNLTLVLISQRSLPFETHSFELEGRFTRMTAETLELSREETTEFFRPALQKNLLTQVAVEHLYSLTEGWITPLALYQLELEEQGAGRVPLPEARSVVSFLRGLVQERLTPAQVRSLAIMAELEVMTDELFMAIADHQCDRNFLPSVAVAQGLPVRCIPNRGRWYRMVSLVREWLLMSAPPGREARATLASEWFYQRGQYGEALRYALICHDPERSTRIAAVGSEALLVGQDTASLLSLRQTLPIELIHNSPRLRVVFSWVHAFGGQFAEARTLLEGIPDASRQTLKGRLAASEVFLLSGEGYVERALAEAEAALGEPDLTPHGRLITLLVKSDALCALGRSAEAREVHREAAKLARQSGDAGAELLAVYTHSKIELSKGALKHAEHLLRTGLDAATSEPVRPPRVGESRLMLNLALVLWHQGRLAEANHLLVRFVRQAEKGRDLVLLVALALRTLSAKVKGRMEEAFSWIGQAERVMQAWHVDEVVYEPVLEALKISCWLAQGQIESATQAMARLKPYRKQNRVLELFPMMPGLLDTLEVRLALANGRIEEARTLLDGKAFSDSQDLPFGHRLHSGLLKALVQFDQGGGSKAFELVASVIEQAASEDYISPFLELKGEIKDMMVQVLAGMPASSFTDSLRQLYGVEASAGGARGAELPEPISDREFGVLELIAMGLSNQGIADKLHISLHTVKTHARRINAKLGVKSRTQAIVRARELGLL
ncbi:LuxR C-terminal-related transcriptional regulator [Marinobacter zhejiangensis]|uniref:LuxR C-terminal-related transcriptional regulator n=1 Tax=Marinobacter zhejiangensis TaxID=488535 RepID=UPI001114156E|nr:LuxR C-terminal-related transcriptional regulator [Marinobacter zhejiangensis]